ncbi:homogentisate phytyltransferase 1, chloroplastic-like protein [Tanacetum coccineum]
MVQCLILVRKRWLGYRQLKVIQPCSSTKVALELHSNLNLLFVKVIKALHGQEGGFDFHGCKTNGLWAKLVGTTNHLHSSGILPANSSNLVVRNSAHLRDMLIEISQVDTRFGSDTYVWSIANDGVFSLGATRRHIDAHLLPTLDPPTTWDKFFLAKRSNTHINQNFLEPLIHEHRINDKMFKLNAASSDNPQSDAIYDLIKPKKPVISFLDILYRFIRPYAAVGMVLKIVSISFLTVEKLSDVSPLFFMKKLLALVGCIFMQMYVSGFNQICDIELDKVNKPYLPLAARELSMETAVILFIISYCGLIDCMDWIQMFWTSIWIIEFAFAAAAFVGATSSITWSKYITTIGEFPRGILQFALVLLFVLTYLRFENSFCIHYSYSLPNLPLSRLYAEQTFFRKRRNNTSAPLNKVELHENLLIVFRYFYSCLFTKNLPDLLLTLDKSCFKVSSHSVIHLSPDKFSGGAMS